jgi:IS5 family transposase
MAATAWNLKKLMEKLKEKFLQLILRLFFPTNFYYLAAGKGILRKDYIFLRND